MTYRVVHLGTGNAGKLALRGILAHPDLELVGLHAYTPEKIGRDAGELAGVDPMRRAPRPATSTRCSRSTPTASATWATGSRTRAPSVDDHGPLPRGRPQRRDDLGTRPGEPGDRGARAARSDRGGVPGRRHHLLLQRRRPGLRQRPDPGHAAVVDGRRPGRPHPGDHQLRLLRPGRDDARPVRVRAAAELRRPVLQQRGAHRVLGRRHHAHRDAARRRARGDPRDP